MRIVGYFAIHSRLRAQRGPAYGHRCCGCGLLGNHWAYDHEDPDEITDSADRTYSLDLARYQPMCGTCHFRFDAPYSKDPRRLTGMVCPTFPIPCNREHSMKIGHWPPKRTEWPPAGNPLPLRW